MTLAVGSLVAMMLLEGSSPLAVVLVPPLILVFGGTFGAAIAGSAFSDVRRIGSWFRPAFAPEKLSRNREAPETAQSPPGLLAKALRIARA